MAPDESQQPGTVPNNPLFRVVIFVSAVFLITVVLLIATSFSNSKSGVVQFMQNYGVELILGEVAVVLSLTFLAMAIDRRQTILRKAHKARGETPDGEAVEASGSGERSE